MELDDREEDPLLDALETYTGLPFYECRRRYYREAIAVFEWKLDPRNRDLEVAKEARRTRRGPDEILSHWRRVLDKYGATLASLESPANKS